MSTYTVTRRAALAGIGTLAVPQAVIAAPPAVDPLIGAIAAYHIGEQDYNDNAPRHDINAEIEYGQRSWRPPYQRLVDWTDPAVTREGAIAALRLTIEVADGDWIEKVIPSMLNAVLAYLDQEGRS